MLIEREVAGGIISTMDVGNDVLPPASRSILGFDQVAGRVVSEIAPVNNVVVPIAPPVRVFVVPYVVVENLRLVINRDPVFQVMRIIVEPLLGLG